MADNLMNSPTCGDSSGKRPVYIEGYLTQRIDAGETPDYGYPKNHVPEAVVAEMNLPTGYMAGKRA